LARDLLASGSDGLIVCGTTGESATLFEDEELKLYRAVKEAVGNDGVVLAATSSYNTHESVELTRKAVGTGVDGFLLTVPYYNKPPQEGLYQHFAAIAAVADGLPCVPYNIPSRTGVNMTPETIIRLAQIPNIAGVKEASGNLDSVSKIVSEAPHLKIWSGDDQVTLPLLSVGGYGVICVVSHLAGRQMKGMIEAYVDGRVAEAAATHRRLLPLMTALMTIASNPIPVKHALNALGYDVGGFRLPLCDLDEAAADRLMTEVRKHQIDMPVRV
jgi:4-hydroxy-tetrahydrodipicolinate synthase